MRGGTDVNCGALYGEQLAGAVTAGLLREDELDVALTRVCVHVCCLGSASRWVAERVLFFTLCLYVHVRVCVCVCVCARACVCACVCACVRAYVRACVRV